MNRLIAFMASLWRALFVAPLKALKPDGTIRLARDPMAIVGKNNQIETIWLPVADGRRVAPLNARLITERETKPRDSP